MTMTTGLTAEASLTSHVASSLPNRIPSYQPGMSPTRLLMERTTIVLTLGVLFLEAALTDLGKIEEKFWLTILLAVMYSGVVIDLCLLAKSRQMGLWIMWSIQLFTFAGYVFRLHARESQFAITFVRSLNTELILLIIMMNQGYKMRVMNPTWADAIEGKTTEPTMQSENSGLDSSAPPPELTSPANPSRALESSPTSPELNSQLPAVGRLGYAR